MSYEFPKITHIDQVREAITGRKEFIEAVRDGFIVFNYLVSLEDTFPKVTNEREAILRECRGLTFHADTGEVAARKFHKFFNVGERLETEIRKIDVSKPHVILEKLDGSMITPFFPGRASDVDCDLLRWHTKMGETDVAALVYGFIANNQHYARYAAHVMANNYTPIFEWCSRKQRIVIDYPVDRLVLTAVRNNTTGEYLHYNEMLKAATHGIDVVKAYPGSIENMKEFIDEARGLLDTEGYVIRFDDGHMYKIKAEAYLMLHKAISKLAQEKDVWYLTLNNSLDDLMPLLNEEDQNRVKEFSQKFWYHFAVNESKLIRFVEDAKKEIFTDNLRMFENADQEAKKMFAIHYVQRLDSRLRSCAFQLWDDKDSHEVLHNFIQSNVSTNTKVDKIRDLFGNLRWKEVEL